MPLFIAGELPHTNPSNPTIITITDRSANLPKPQLITPDPNMYIPSKSLPSARISVTTKLKDRLAYLESEFEEVHFKPVTLTSVSKGAGGKKKVKIDKSAKLSKMNHRQSLDRPLAMTASEPKTTNLMARSLHCLGQSKEEAESPDSSCDTPRSSSAPSHIKPIPSVRFVVDNLIVTPIKEGGSSTHVKRKSPPNYFLL